MSGVVKRALACLKMRTRSAIGALSWLCFISAILLPIFGTFAAAYKWNLARALNELGLGEPDDEDAEHASVVVRGEEPVSATTETSQVGGTGVVHAVPTIGPEEAESDATTPTTSISSSAAAPAQGSATQAFAENTEEYQDADGYSSTSQQLVQTGEPAVDKRTADTTGPVASEFQMANTKSASAQWDSGISALLSPTAAPSAKPAPVQALDDSFADASGASSDQGEIPSTTLKPREAGSYWRRDAAPEAGPGLHDLFKSWTGAYFTKLPKPTHTLSVPIKRDLHDDDSDDSDDDMEDDESDQYVGDVGGTRIVARGYDFMSVFASWMASRHLPIQTATAPVTTTAPPAGLKRDDQSADDAHPPTSATATTVPTSSTSNPDDEPNLEADDDLANRDANWLARFSSWTAAHPGPTPASPSPSSTTLAPTIEQSDVPAAAALESDIAKRAADPNWRSKWASWTTANFEPLASADVPLIPRDASIPSSLADLQWRDMLSSWTAAHLSPAVTAPGDATDPPAATEPPAAETGSGTDVPATAPLVDRDVPASADAAPESDLDVETREADAEARTSEPGGDDDQN